MADAKLEGSKPERTQLEVVLLDIDGTPIDSTDAHARAWVETLAIVVAALERARCSPAQALLLGDTPYDVTASARAGVRSVALRCGGWDDASLAGAIAIYDDPAALLAELEHSPFARGAR